MKLKLTIIVAENDEDFRERSYSDYENNYKLNKFELNIRGENLRYLKNNQYGIFVDDYFYVFKENKNNGNREKDIFIISQRIRLNNKGLMSIYLNFTKEIFTRAVEYCVKSSILLSGEIYKKCDINTLKNIFYDPTFPESEIIKNIDQFKQFFCFSTRQFSKKTIIDYFDLFSPEYVKVFQKDIPEKFLLDMDISLIFENLSFLFYKKVSSDTLEQLLLKSIGLIPESQIERFFDIVSESQDLSMEFIEKYKPDLYITMLSRNQKLSEEFIEKHIDEVDWNNLFTYDNLSDDFIEKYSDKIDWWEIGRKKELSLDFVRRFNDFLKLDNIVMNKSFNDDLLDEYCNIMGNSEYNSVSFNSKISNKQIRKFLPLLNKDLIYKNKNIKKDEELLEILNLTSDDYRRLRFDCPIPENEIIKIKNEIGWFCIRTLNPPSDNFFEEVKDVIDWDAFLKNHKIKDEQIYKFRKEIGIDNILKNKDISMEYFKKIVMCFEQEEI